MRAEGIGTIRPKHLKELRKMQNYSKVMEAVRAYAGLWLSDRGSASDRAAARAEALEAVEVALVRLAREAKREAVYPWTN